MDSQDPVDRGSLGHCQAADSVTNPTDLSLDPTPRKDLPPRPSMEIETVVWWFLPHRSYGSQPGSDSGFGVKRETGPG